MIMHKKYLSLLIFTLALSAESSQLNTQMTNPLMELIVHKTPTCGCCKMWVNHMENNGFAINTQDHQSLLKIKDNLKIEPQFRSCHTAVSSEGYFLRDIFLANILVNFSKKIIQKPLVYRSQVCL